MGREGERERVLQECFPRGDSSVLGWGRASGMLPWRFSRRGWGRAGRMLLRRLRELAEDWSLGQGWRNAPPERPANSRAVVEGLRGRGRRYVAPPGHPPPAPGWLGIRFPCRDPASCRQGFRLPRGGDRRRFHTVGLSEKEEKNYFTNALCLFLLCCLLAGLPMSGWRDSASSVAPLF